MPKSTFYSALYLALSALALLFDLLVSDTGVQFFTFL